MSKMNKKTRNNNKQRQQTKTQTKTRSNKKKTTQEKNKKRRASGSASWGSAAGHGVEHDLRPWGGRRHGGPLGVALWGCPVRGPPRVGAPRKAPRGAPGGTLGEICVGSRSGVCAEIHSLVVGTWFPTGGYYSQQLPRAGLESPLVLKLRTSSFFPQKVDLTSALLFFVEFRCSVFFSTRLRS